MWERRRFEQPPHRARAAVEEQQIIATLDHRACAGPIEQRVGVPVPSSLSRRTMLAPYPSSADSAASVP